MTEASIINRSVEKARLWLDEVAAGLESEDRNRAYRVLRAYLHARDRAGDRPLPQTYGSRQSILENQC